MVLLRDSQVLSSTLSQRVCCAGAALMMKILDWQVRHFDARMLAQLVQRTVKRVRRSFPRACTDLSDDVLAQRIHRALTLARSLGLRTERDGDALVDLMMVFGEHVGEQPGVRAVLEDGSLDALARVDAVYELLGDPALLGAAGQGG